MATTPVKKSKPRASQHATSDAANADGAPENLVDTPSKSRKKRKINEGSLENEDGRPDWGNQTTAANGDIARETEDASTIKGSTQSPNWIVY